MQGGSTRLNIQCSSVLPKPFLPFPVARDYLVYLIPECVCVIKVEEVANSALSAGFGDKAEIFLV